MQLRVSSLASRTFQIGRQTSDDSAHQHDSGFPKIVVPKGRQPESAVTTSRDGSELRQAFSHRPSNVGKDQLRGYRCNLVRWIGNVVTAQVRDLPTVLTKPLINVPNDSSRSIDLRGAQPCTHMAGPRLSLSCSRPNCSVDLLRVVRQVPTIRPFDIPPRDGT